MRPNNNKPNYSMTSCVKTGIKIKDSLQLYNQHKEKDEESDALAFYYSFSQIVICQREVVAEKSQLAIPYH